MKGTWFCSLFVCVAVFAADNHDIQSDSNGRDEAPVSEVGSQAIRCRELLKAKGILRDDLQLDESGTFYNFGNELTVYSKTGIIQYDLKEAKTYPDKEYFVQFPGKTNFRKVQSSSGVMSMGIEVSELDPDTQILISPRALPEAELVLDQELKDLSVDEKAMRLEALKVGNYLTGAIYRFPRSLEALLSSEEEERAGKLLSNIGWPLDADAELEELKPCFHPSYGDQKYIIENYKRSLDRIRSKFAPVERVLPERKMDWKEFGERFARNTTSSELSKRLQSTIGDVDDALSEDTLEAIKRANEREYPPSEPVEAFARTVTIEQFRTRIAKRAASDAAASHIAEDLEKDSEFADVKFYARAVSSYVLFKKDGKPYALSVYGIPITVGLVQTDPEVKRVSLTSVGETLELGKSWPESTLPNKTSTAKLPQLYSNRTELRWPVGQPTGRVDRLIRMGSASGAYQSINEEGGFAKFVKMLFPKAEPALIDEAFKGYSIERKVKIHD